MHKSKPLPGYVSPGKCEWVGPQCYIYYGSNCSCMFEVHLGLFSKNKHVMLDYPKFTIYLQLALQQMV